MSTTRAVTALAALIHESQQRRSTATGVALDVDSAGMLMSPETAAELVILRAGTGSCEVLREMHAAAEQENTRLRERVAELEAVAIPAIRRLAPSAATVRVQEDMRRAAAELDSADRIVAYRNPDQPGVLLCREHGDGWGGLAPLASDDLPDGGICTYGRPSETECGRDVLITGAETGGA